MEEHSPSSSNENTYIGGPLDGEIVPEDLREDSYGLVRYFREGEAISRCHLYVACWQFWGYAGCRDCTDYKPPNEDEIRRAFRVLGVK